MDEQVGELGREGGEVLRRGEVVLGLGPGGDREDDAVDQLADAGLPLGRVEVAAEVLADDDVGGQLAPGRRDLDVLLLEDELAGLVADGGGPDLPGDLVVGMDARAGPAALEGEAARPLAREAEGVHGRRGGLLGPGPQGGRLGEGVVGARGDGLGAAGRPGRGAGSAARLPACRAAWWAWRPGGRPGRRRVRLEPCCACSSSGPAARRPGSCRRRHAPGPAPGGPPAPPSDAPPAGAAGAGPIRRSGVLRRRRSCDPRRRGCPPPARSWPLRRSRRRPARSRAVPVLYRAARGESTANHKM